MEIEITKAKFRIIYLFCYQLQIQTNIFDYKSILRFIILQKIAYTYIWNDEIQSELVNIYINFLVYILN